MKRVSLGVQLLLRLVLGGLIVSGGVMHFTKDVASYHSSFIDAMSATGYLWQLIGIVNLVAGTAILAGRFVPLALLILAPVSLNIFLYHLSHAAEGGVGIGIIIAGCHLGLAWFYRYNFSSLFCSLPEKRTADSI
jgi:putative oxidoreductase